eukprot:4903890-Prymnesium_polylepis.1
MGMSPVRRPRRARGEVISDQVRSKQHEWHRNQRSARDARTRRPFPTLNARARRPSPARHLTPHLPRAPAKPSAAASQLGVS